MNSISSPAVNPALLYAFPVFFVSMWLVVTTLLTALCGWFHLRKRYPDRPEQPNLRLRGQSGMMGVGVGMSRILILSACPSGLRVAISRLFGPFAPPFLVPWAEIATEPRTMFFVKSVRLGFGMPETGVLTVDVGTWRKLAAAVPTETSALLVPHPTQKSIALSIALQWAAITGFVGCFFYFISRSTTAPVPLIVCFGFPGVIFGIAQLFRYLGQRR